MFKLKTQPKLYVFNLAYILIATSLVSSIIAQDVKLIDSIQKEIKNENNSQNICLLYTTIASEYYHTVPDSALHYCDIALNYAYKAHSITDISYLHNFIGVLYKNINLYDSANINFEQAIKYYDLDDFEQGKASALNNLAQTHKLLGNYDIALNNYYASLEIFERYKDTLFIGELHSNIGAILLEINEFDSAEEHFLISRKHYMLAKSQINEAWTLYDLGTLMLKKGNLDEAKDYFINSQRIWNVENRNKEKNDCSLRIVEIELLQGNCKDLIDELNIIIDVYESLKNPQGMAESHLILGRVAICQNNYNLAIIHLLKAKEMAERIGTEKIRLPVYYELHLTYKFLSDYENALYFIEKYIQLKDSLYTDARQKLMAEFQTKLNVANKEYFIKQLEDSAKQQNIINELISHENSRKQTSIYILFSVIVVIIFLIYLIYKRNTRYIALNKELQLSLIEREALIREVHHRVKNNLQIISSLLNLQSYKATSGTTESEILKSSQSRVDAMSMIHESLYKSEKISNIKFSDYINDLCKYINASYDLDNKGIILNANIEEIVIDIDKMVPCGLIITELITNSIKHAFENKISDKQIDIIGKNKNNLIRILIKDNGIGIPEGFDINNLKSLGLRLVNGLTKQIGTDLHLVNNNGLIVWFEFKTTINYE